MTNPDARIPESRAAAFFKALESSPSTAFEVIAGMIGKTDESEWLELKDGASITGPVPAGKVAEEEKRRDNVIKEYWSECLSAFANSGGGVLIWGISAPAAKAEKLSLVHDVERLAERLRQIQNDAVDPPVQGVAVLAVTEGVKKSGFVVCFVPDSLFAPHAAKWAEREYYIRTGDGNRRMQTALLRRMFYPHISAFLVPVVSVRLLQDARALHLNVKATIINRGTASAEEAYAEVIATSDRPSTAFAASPWESRPYSPRGFHAQKTIHPGESVPFLQSVTTGRDYDGYLSSQFRFNLSFRLFAKNCTPVAGGVEFSGEEINSTLEKNAFLTKDCRVEPTTSAALSHQS